MNLRRLFCQACLKAVTIFIISSGFLIHGAYANPDPELTSDQTSFSPVEKTESYLTYTWEDCVAEAKGDHPDLHAAREGVNQSKASKAITQSGLFPQVESDLAATTSKSLSAGQSNSFSYGVTGTQLLFDGFKTAHQVKGAQEKVKASQFSYMATSSVVLLRLRQAFINLLKAQDLLNLTQEIYKIRKSNLDLITLRYQSGTEHKGALLTAQANLSQSSFEINQAKRGIETAQRQLLKELGRTQFFPITVKGSFDVGNVVLEKPDFEALSKENPELLKIIAQTNAAAFDVKADKGDFLPVISADGGVSKSASHWPPDEKGTSAGIRVFLPIFEGGARVARLSQAQSIYRQLQEDERSTQDGIIVGLEQAWNALQDSVENVKVQKDFLMAAEERAKIAEQQYSVGLISFDNWTIIEDDLVGNKKSFLNVQAAALLAEANWIQAKGETLENEN